MRKRLAAIPIALVALALAALAAVVFAENIDPLSDDSQRAWSENAGWLNAEPANCGNCGITVSSTKLTGYMWGENIGWVSLSCENTYGVGCAGSPGGNWGVTNNGSGTLGGYAWAENVGWISFSCANAGSCGTVSYGVTINGTTGVFSGYAWGENIGWISFSDSSPVAYKVQTGNCPTGAATAWVVPAGDVDCDGFTSAVETTITTDPGDPCGFTPGVPTESETWPADLVESNSINISDVLALKPVFGTAVPPTSARYDVVPSGGINISDVLVIKPFFGKSCTP